MTGSSHVEPSESRFISVTVRRTTLETYVLDRTRLTEENWAIDGLDPLDLTSKESVGDYVLDEFEEIASGGLSFVHKLNGLCTDEDPEIHEVSLEGRLEPTYETPPDSACERCGNPTWGVVDDEPVCADCWAVPVLLELTVDPRVEEADHGA
jgi:hypothetical protein